MNHTLYKMKVKITTVEPQSIVFQGDGETKRRMREND